jgi:hypothetical protein
LVVPTGTKGPSPCFTLSRRPKNPKIFFLPRATAEPPTTPTHPRRRRTHAAADEAAAADAAATADAAAAARRYLPGPLLLFSAARIHASPLAAADPFVVSLALKACAAAADAGHAASLHAFAVRSSAVSSDAGHATALADAYAKAGRLALRVFDEMLVGALTRAGRRSWAR